MYACFFLCLHVSVGVYVCVRGCGCECVYGRGWWVVGVVGVVREYKFCAGRYNLL